tara:strand:+ start:2705 stop:3178 length:474 start_codon:yes stop_codon:yes gene_type:complete
MEVKMSNKVAIILGSANDKKYVEDSYKYFDFFSIEVETHVISAHRNPDEVADFAKSAREKGYKILIGGAGMAAHLSGALKANSTLPVIGVPFPGGVSDGMDALLATVQMPKGVPVATMSVGKHGVINAAILSAEILSLNDNSLVDKLSEFKKNGATV